MKHLFVYVHDCIVHFIKGFVHKRNDIEKK
jgi:hypothetical protein